MMMRIAEDIQKDGATGGKDFLDFLTTLIVTNRITRVIETGTLHGTGTTRAILTGLKKVTWDFQFISIECNPENMRIAQRNLSSEKVQLFNGLSIPDNLKPGIDSIRFDDYPDDIIVDHPERERAARYYRETNFDVQDCLLQLALEFIGGHPELIVLDSAGHMGTIEFDYLMSLVSDKKIQFYIALDDTGHVKHFKTKQKIRADSRFTPVFSSTQKFGSDCYFFQNDRGDSLAT